MWADPPGVDVPRLTAALAAQPTDSDREDRANRAFDFGITVLIDGLERLLTDSQ